MQVSDNIVTVPVTDQFNYFRINAGEEKFQREQLDTSLAINPRWGSHKVNSSFSVHEIVVGVIFSTFRRESGCAQVDLWGGHYFP